MEPRDPAGAELRELVSTRRVMLAFIAPMLLLVAALGLLRFAQRMEQARADLLQQAQLHARDLQWLTGSLPAAEQLPVLQLQAREWAPADGHCWVLDARTLEPLLDSTAAGQDLAPAFTKADLQQALAHGPLRREGWLLAVALRPGAPLAYASARPLASIGSGFLIDVLPNAAIALMILGIFIAAQWYIARRFVLPATQLLGYLRALSADHLAAAPELPGRWQIWTATLADTFARQHELQQRERGVELRKSAILDNALEAMVSCDAQGHIVEFNPAAQAMFQHTVDQARGMNLADLMGPSLQVEGPVAGGRRALLARRRDGSEFPAEMVSWRTDIGGQVLFTASLLDVSERVQARAELERHRESLRQSEKLSAMGGLLAGVAHELNNPLAIVMGRAGLLADKLEGHPLQDDARRIREAAERCGRMVHSFLGMARASAAPLRPLALNDVAQAAADLLGFTLHSHGIGLELSLDPALPEVLGDVDQLVQIVLNLLLNAQHALAGSETAGRIVLSTGRAGGAGVWLRVRDNGPGVAESVRDRLFDPFVTTKPEGQGTGLGLSVSQALALAHQGSLALEAAGPGASFLLSLPPAPQPALRLLVVEDESRMTALLRETLEAEGYEVATAESGEVALALLEEARFDGIISGRAEPELGVEQAPRVIRPDVPFDETKLLQAIRQLARPG